MTQHMIRLVVLLGVLWETSSEPYRFVLIEGPMTWQGSQEYCRQNHIDLATVQSDEDRVKLKEAADAAGFSSFGWIGLYNGVFTWRWSYQNEPISYENWESWEPDTYRTQEACAFLSSNQRWGDINCFEEKHFFCQTDKNKFADKFKYVTESLKWREAQLYCRTHYIDLATVTHDTDNTGLANLITPGNHAWIGLSKNLWLWSDQTSIPMPLIKWQSGQPDNVDGKEECGCAGTEGEVADDICTTLRSFYCKTPDGPAVRRVQIVRVAVRSSGSLNAPAVMEALEKQMIQMLSGQRMDKGSNVTGRIQPDGTLFHRHGDDRRETRTACEDISPAGL